MVCPSKEKDVATKDMTSNRVVLHVDLDYFYAQVEEREHPEYKGKPVVVCMYSGRTSDSGVVSTANYIARRFGVRSGIPIAFAKRYLKDQDAIFVPVNHQFYVEVSNQIMEILRGFTTKFEQVSIDEAYLDITERVQGDFKAAKVLARQLKDEIQHKQGLTCSVGLGVNRLVSKIAANQQKPDGLTVVTPDKIVEFLEPLPVGRLYGVGKKTEKVLLDKGVKTVGDLANHPMEDLIKTFGKTLGIYFHEAAQGVDNTPVQERTGVKSISRITTLKADTRDIDTLIMTTDDLSADVCSSLKSDNLGFRTVNLVIVAEDMSAHTKSLTLDSITDDLQTLKQAVKQLIQDYLQGSELNARRIGIRVSNLSRVLGQKRLNTYIE